MAKKYDLDIYLSGVTKERASMILEFIHHLNFENEVDLSATVTLLKIDAQEEADPPEKEVGESDD